MLTVIILAKLGILIALTTTSNQFSVYKDYFQTTSKAHTKLLLVVKALFLYENMQVDAQSNRII